MAPQLRLGARATPAGGAPGMNARGRPGAREAPTERGTISMFSGENALHALFDRAPKLRDQSDASVPGAHENSCLGSATLERLALRSGRGNNPLRCIPPHPTCQPLAPGRFLPHRGLRPPAPGS
eukprot:8504091-Pyramimonas_sp.AAC.1